MTVHELLEHAIENRTPIRFFYAGSRGGEGERVGSPHALYAHPTTRNISCDIFQHRGASASGNEAPFKPFVLSKITGVYLLQDEAFQVWELYDPDAPRYVNAIAKIMG